jgi:hypothetical protein
MAEPGQDWVTSPALTGIAADCAPALPSAAFGLAAGWFLLPWLVMSMAAGDCVMINP